MILGNRPVWAETKALFAEMRANAIALGEDMVEAERALNRDFETDAIDAKALESALLKIGKLRARIRYVHLEAHLRQKRLLTKAQVAQYDRIRGYSLTDGNHAEHSQHHE